MPIKGVKVKYMYLLDGARKAVDSQWNAKGRHWKKVGGQ